MLRRAKSTAANLLFAAAAFGFPFFFGAAWGPYVVFLALFLWPIGVYYLYCAIAGDSGEAANGNARSLREGIAVRNTEDARSDNREAVLRWVTRAHPKWPSSTQVAFADFVADHLGEQRWDGSNESPRFSVAVDAYLKQVHNIK